MRLKTVFLLSSILVIIAEAKAERDGPPGPKPPRKYHPRHFERPELSSKPLQHRATIDIVRNHFKAQDKTGWNCDVVPRFANKSSQDLAHLFGTTILTDDEVADMPQTSPNQTVSQNRSLLTRAGPTMYLPTSFDSRVQWSSCNSTKEIRDQGGCGSCWAHSVAEALSDRLCIFSYSRSNSIHISAQDFMTCCSICGGCNGGSVESAYNYFKVNGSVTGGNYGQLTGCRPYTIPEVWPNITLTPTCLKTCQPSYTRSYNQDVYRGNYWYMVSKTDATTGNVTSDTVNNIMTEIYRNGPVSCSMKVYEDFLTYKSGVYTYVTGNYLGGHAVKCIGWGTDSATGTPYWLVANSWGTSWGESGFFRIRRGTNEANIEARVYAGFPYQY